MLTSDCEKKKIQKNNNFQSYLNPAEQKPVEVKKSTVAEKAPTGKKL